MVKKSVIASLASLALVSSTIVAIPAIAAPTKDECHEGQRGCSYHPDVGLWLWDHHRDAWLWIGGGLAVGGTILAVVLTRNNNNENQPVSP